MDHVEVRPLLAGKRFLYILYICLQFSEEERIFSFMYMLQETDLAIKQTYNHPLSGNA